MCVGAQEEVSIRCCEGDFRAAVALDFSLIQAIIFFINSVI